MQTLIDTNVLLAIIDPQDPSRKRLVSDFAKVFHDQLFVTWPVLTESIYLSKPLDRRRRLIAFLREKKVTLAEKTFPLEEEPIWDWLLKYGDHSPDFADAQLMVFASQYSNLRLWTYDSEFTTIWRRLDGTTVTLV